MISIASARGAVLVVISPASASIKPSATQQFTATVTGTTTTGVQWSVDGVNGGNSTVGTVSTGGLYTAPAVSGTHFVKATSVADSTKSASAKVTIFSSISVDFGSRSSTALSIHCIVVGQQFSLCPVSGKASAHCAFCYNKAVDRVAICTVR
jgi:hypothetical protein